MYAAVFDHVGQAFLGILRVERHVGATGLENRQQANHHFDGALDADTHQHVGPHALLAQGMGQLVGARIQLGVGQGGGTEHQCRCIGAAPRLVFDQVMNPALGRVRLGGLVPAVDQPLLFSRVKHGQFANALFAIEHHGLQQAGPVPGHALDGGRIEQVIGVGQRGMQGAGLFIGVQGQVELGGAALPFHQGQFQPRCGADRGDVGDDRLMVIHHLEQRRVAQAALDFQRFHQPFEGQLLMGLGAQSMLLDTLQQLGNPGLPGQFGAQHLGVDEEPDQPLDFGAIAIGNRHTDADVALAGIAVQQHIEGTEQQHEQGDVMFLRAAAQLRGQCRLNREVMPRALVAGHGRARVVGGQLQNRMFIAQASLPIFQLARLLARFQPAALPQGVITVLDGQRWQLGRFVALMGVIATDEFVDQHVHRPTVGDDVVQGQQQHVFLLGKLEQLYAQQWAVFQVERQQRLTGGGGVDGLLTRIKGQGGEVQVLDGHRRLHRHLRQPLISLTLEHRAQGFVTRHQAGERLLQRWQAQRPPQAHCARQIVGAAGRVQLP